MSYKFSGENINEIKKGKRMIGSWDSKQERNMRWIEKRESEIEKEKKRETFNEC